MKKVALALVVLAAAAGALLVLRHAPVKVVGAEMAFDLTPVVRAHRSTLDLAVHGTLGPPWKVLTSPFGHASDSGFFVVDKVVFTQPIEARHYRLHGHVHRTGANGTPVFDPEPDHDPHVASVLVDLESMGGQAAKVDQAIDGELEFDLVPIGKGRITGWVTMVATGSLPGAKEPATVTVDTTFDGQLE